VDDDEVPFRRAGAPARSSAIEKLECRYHCRCNTRQANLRIAAVSSQLTARLAVERIRQQVGIPWREKTVDNCFFWRKQA
jgi:hypothetical protein